MHSHLPVGSLWPPIYDGLMFALIAMIALVYSVKKFRVVSWIGLMIALGCACWAVDFIADSFVNPIPYSHYYRTGLGAIAHRDNPAEVLILPGALFLFAALLLYWNDEGKLRREWIAFYLKEFWLSLSGRSLK